MTVDHCTVDRDKACKLVRGTRYDMIMSFTPDFDGSDIEVIAYTKIANTEASFQGMEKDACKLMQCPVANGVPHEYHFYVTMDMLKPRGTFTTQWRMTQNKVNKCCFENKFKIV